MVASIWRMQTRLLEQGRRSWSRAALSTARATSRTTFERCGRRSADWLAQGANAARARENPPRCAIDHDRCLLDVGQPAAVGLAVGVAHVVAVRHALATQLTATRHV